MYTKDRNLNISLHYSDPVTRKEEKVVAVSEEGQDKRATNSRTKTNKRATTKV